ncbi:MAG: ABC transporter permease [Bacillota bacterium]
MKLYNIALNDLRRRKAKMAFLVVGMVIGIATIVALYTITTAMEREIADKFDQIGANMTVVPKTDDLSLSYGGVSAADVANNARELDMSAIPKIRSIKNKENIATIAPKLVGAMKTGGRDKLVMGVQWENELRMKRWWKIDGQKPARADDVLLGSNAARELNKKPGDELVLGSKKFRVAGVLKELGGQEDAVVFMDLATTQQLLGKKDKVSFLEVSALCATCPIEEIIAQISDKLPEANATAIKEVVQARKDFVDRFSNMALAVSGIVLAIGSLVVLITMMSSVNERTREIGIFRAIGFRKSHVIGIILLEAAVVSVIGGLAGYLTGMVTAKFAAPVIAQMDVAINWDPTIGLAALGLAVAIGLAASLFPAVQASRQDPVEALRFI